MKQVRMRKPYKMMVMMMMMMCFTGSKYSDSRRVEEKKWTQYFNIRLLSPEMYFDVHYG